MPYRERDEDGLLGVIFRELQKKQVEIVAQLVEQYTFNVWVLGSSPNGITE